MKRSKARTLDIGSVSSGTMRPEDLIPEFLDVADSLRLSAQDRKTVREIRREFHKAIKDEASHIRRVKERAGLYWQDCADDDLSTLFDVLGNYAPAFCTFGAHPGDGADYGVWPDHDSLEMAIHDGEIWRDQGNGAAPPASDWRYRMVVSDHGNVSLYHRNGREVWGIV